MNNCRSAMFNNIAVIGIYLYQSFNLHLDLEFEKIFMCHDADRFDIE